MPAPPSPADNDTSQDAPHSTWRRLEAVLLRFEESWRRGERPAIDDFLPADPADRRRALVELAFTELEFRVKEGDPLARAEDYLGRYPDLADDSATAAGLI